MSLNKILIHATRRQLFTDLREAAKARDGQRAGRPAFKLQDLGLMNDDELLMITPVIAAQCTITVEGERVTVRHRDADATVMFDIDSLDAKIFNTFNGYTSIGESCSNLLLECNLPEEIIVQEVRRVFFDLVSHRLCLPQ